MFLTAAAAVCALAAAVWFLLDSDGGGATPAVPRMHRLRLASRTLEVRSGSFPSEFSGQVPSARGTAVCCLLCAGVPDAGVRARAAACGVRVLAPLPDEALLAEASVDALRRAAADPAFSACLEMTPSDKISSSLAACAEDPAAVTVRVVDRSDIPAVMEAVAAAGGESTDEEVPPGDRLHFRLPRAALEGLARRGDVRWMERHVRPHLLNDVAVNKNLMNIRETWDMHGLDGSGQIISTSDTGLDTGNISTLMADFQGQVCRIACDKPSTYSPADRHGHGTHTAGSIVGNGALSGGAIRGSAPGAKLYVWGCGTNLGAIPIQMNRLFDPEPLVYPVRIHSGSWGSHMNVYSTDSELFDEYVWDNPEFLPVMAAGNGWTDSGNNVTSVVSAICAEAGAKNSLAVGATESLRGKTSANNGAQMAPFSSRGPMPDGRTKPDVCAPGTYILSTRTTQVSSYNPAGWGAYSAHSNNYCYSSGTSQATPLVAGAAALVRQWLCERRGFGDVAPSAALVKAILMGGARDLSGDSGADCGGAAPNSAQGWGRVDITETLYPSNREVKLADWIPFSQGSMRTITVATTNAAPLDVQLVWVDHPGDPSAAAALVNDLDLVVSNTVSGEVWLGNDMAGSGTRDAVNNVESVRIRNAPAGEWAISVKGTHVMYSSAEGGAAALYVRGALEMADDEMETVELVVSTEGAEAGATEPAVGVHRIPAGRPMTLRAEDFFVTNSFGTAMRRRFVAGWTGSGDMPASGTDSSVTVTFHRDSAVSWRWDDLSSWLLCRAVMLPSFGEDACLVYNEAWVMDGSILQLPVPESSPIGTDVFDIADYGYRSLEYIDADGTRKTMGVQRLGRVMLAETDGPGGEVLRDAAGHMATNIVLTVTNSFDVKYCYYDSAATNVASGLPEWWWQRNLGAAGALGTADADADGDGSSNAAEFAADTDPLDPESDLRILSFSPPYIAWRGGRWRTQVLERADSLGADAEWTGVLTNLPPVPAFSEATLPASTATNSFFRIRAF